MPLVQHREDLSELISIAAKLKRNMHAKKKEKFISSFLSSSDSSKKGFNSAILEKLLFFSISMHHLIEYYIYKLLRLAVVSTAFITLTYRTSDFGSNKYQYDVMIAALDLYVNVFFIIDGFINFCAMPAALNIEAVSPHFYLLPLIYLRLSGIPNIITGKNR